MSAFPGGSSALSDECPINLHYTDPIPNIVDVDAIVRDGRRIRRRRTTTVALGSAAVVAAERETIAAISRNEGKPEAQLDKIIEGRLTGWYKDRVLVDQAYARDDKMSISQVLGGATVRRFAQVVVGA